MRPVCKFFINSECTNPRCKFLHPLEFPMYIYTLPGIEIHPDELRLAVTTNEAMAIEADNVWINNYRMFCMNPEEKAVDILEHPDYFCMPFEMQRVCAEVEKIKAFCNQNPNRPQFDDKEYRPSFSKPSFNKPYSNPNYNPTYNKSYSNKPSYNTYENKSYNAPYDNNSYNKPYSNNPNYNSYNKPYNNNPNYSSYQNRSFQENSNNPQNFVSSWSSSEKNINDQQDFERKQNRNEDLNQKEEDTPDYEYQNIPYNYK